MMLNSEKFPKWLNKSIEALYIESGNPGRSVELGTSLVNGDITAEEAAATIQASWPS